MNWATRNSQRSVVFRLLRAALSGRDLNGVPARFMPDCLFGGFARAAISTPGAKPAATPEMLCRIVQRSQVVAPAHVAAGTSCARKCRERQEACHALWRSPRAAMCRAARRRDTSRPHNEDSLDAVLCRRMRAILRDATIVAPELCAR